MHYVLSDIHGNEERFRSVLRKIDLKEDDTLYVLGDVIDRGEEGVHLLRWMAEQPNVQLILGNHEAMLLSCPFLFKEANEENAEALFHIEEALRWMAKRVENRSKRGVLGTYEK